MNKFNRALLAGVASTALSLTLAAPASADMFAYSKLLIEDFLILGSDGNVLDASTDFASLAYTSSADYDGALTGTAGFSQAEPNGADIDFVTRCLSTTGDCSPLTENNFEFLTGAQGKDYVAADQMQVGSPIDNLPGFALGADIGQVAVGSLSATAAKGSANVNNGLEAKWEFSLAQAQGITFEGEITAYMEAFAGAGELFPGKASAAITFTITITDLETDLIVFLVSENLLNITTSANADGDLSDTRTCGLMAAFTGGMCGVEFSDPTFSVTTGLLLANNRYQLSIRGNANIDIARVNEVPEPGVLALLGLGFVGMFVAGGRRRRRV